MAGGNARHAPSLVLLLVLAHISTFSNAIPAGFFWQLTDLHYAPDYTEGDTGSCNKQIPQQALGVYGNFQCDSPHTLVRSAIQAMSYHGGAPDFILWSGGSVQTMNSSIPLSQEKIIEILNTTTNMLLEYFPDEPVVVTLGNMDYTPSNQLPGEPNPIYGAAANIWSRWLKTEENINTFKKGAYYSQNVDYKIRAVMLNTNLYYKHNMATKGQADPGDQIQWLKDTLASSRANGEKVYLMMHVPPGVNIEDNKQLSLRPEFNQKIIQLVQTFSDVILGAFAGHQHMDSFRLFFKDGEPVTPMFIAPSVTPRRAMLDGDATKLGAPHNPGIRKIFVDKSSWVPTNVYQYYVNLTRANEQAHNTTANWMRLYSYAASYNTLDNLTAAKLAEVVDSFEGFASDRFHRYYDMHTVDMTGYDVKPCGMACKREHICAIRNVDISEFNTCATQLSGCANHGVSVGFLVCLLLVQLLS